jgi:hypothetical protein
MFWKWWWPGYSSRGINVEYGPCHDLEIIPVWQKKLPKFTSESNIRLVNITNDDVLDIVLGFGTGKLKILFYDGFILYCFYIPVSLYLVH